MLPWAAINQSRISLDWANIELNEFFFLLSTNIHLRNKTLQTD